MEIIKITKPPFTSIITIIIIIIMINNNFNNEMKQKERKKKKKSEGNRVNVTRRPLLDGNACVVAHITHIEPWADTTH